MILVTGAAGKTGQTIIQALLKRGAAVRAFVYRPDHQKIVEALGVQEVIVGDMGDAQHYGRAVRGVRALYHICSNMNPAEVEIGQVAMAAAGTAMVDHFVYHSVLHPQTEKMPHHWRKLQVEELLFESGLSFTILQPAAYMQNILASWETVVEQGRYQVPYPAETRLSLIDLNDVAAVAATVLIEPGHEGAIYELAGPDAPTQTEVAAILSRYLDRRVQVEQLSHDSWTARAKAAGLGAYQIETLLKMFRYYEKYHFQGNPKVLTWLLDRPPITFHDFIKRIAQQKS